jgi:hypothetical protein
MHPVNVPIFSRRLRKGEFAISRVNGSYHDLLPTPTTTKELHIYNSCSGRFGGSVEDNSCRDLYGRSPLPSPSTKHVPVVLGSPTTTLISFVAGSRRIQSS